MKGQKLAYLAPRMIDTDGNYTHRGWRDKIQFKESKCEIMKEKKKNTHRGWGDKIQSKERKCEIMKEKK